jgi:DNA replication and repair protein RecF
MIETNSSLCSLRKVKKVLKRNGKAYDKFSDPCLIPLVIISPADDLIVEGSGKPEGVYG